MSDFVSAWETLFGVYSPIEIISSDGSISYMCDWGYISRAAFFILVVFCILKLIGGVLRNDRH